LAEQIRLLVIEDVPQVAMHMRSLLQAQSQIKMLDVITSGEQALSAVTELRPDVLIVDALLQGRVSGMQVAEQVRRTEPTVSVIVLTVPQNPVTENPAAGIDAVLKMPFSGFDLTTMVRKVHEQSNVAGGHNASVMVSLFSPKGGVGRTTLAFNLAVATAVEGRLPSTAPRAGRPRPMCLLTEGALSESLGVDADALMELLERNVARVPDEVVNLAMRHPSGVEGLALAPGRLNVEQLRRLLQLLRRHYDAIVIDCPRGDSWLEEIVTQVVDVLLLVALPSDRSAGECRRWVDRLWRQRAEQRAAVVVNRRRLDHPPEGVTRGFVHSIHISDSMTMADFDSRGAPWVLDTSLAPATEMGKVAAGLMPPMFAEAQSGAA